MGGATLPRCHPSVLIFVFVRVFVCVQFFLSRSPLTDMQTAQSSSCPPTTGWHSTSPAGVEARNLPPSSRGRHVVALRLQQHTGTSRRRHRPVPPEVRCSTHGQSLRSHPVRCNRMLSCVSRVSVRYHCHQHRHQMTSTSESSSHVIIYLCSILVMHIVSV